MRISKRDRKEYNRLRSNLLSKARRVKEQHNINFLSENPDLKLKPLEQMSRSEFNTFKEQSKLMTKRGVPRFSYEKINDQVSVSRSEMMRLKYNENLANKQAAKRYNEIKDKPFYEDGESEGVVGEYIETMKNPDIPGISAPHVADDDEMRSREYVRNKIQQLENYTNQQVRSDRNELMKENYINELKTAFNSDADDLINKIENMPTEDFIELYSMSGDMSFSFFYIEDLDIMQENINNVTTYVDSYYQGNADFDYRNAKNNVNTNVR